MSTKRIALRTISLFFALLIGATAISCGSDGTSEVTQRKLRARRPLSSMTAAFRTICPSLTLKDGL